MNTRKRHYKEHNKYGVGEDDEHASQIKTEKNREGCQSWRNKTSNNIMILHSDKCEGRNTIPTPTWPLQKDRVAVKNKTAASDVKK